MLKKFVRMFGGDPNRRAIDKHTEIVEDINDLEESFEKLTDEELKAKTAEFRAHIDESMRDITDPEERKDAEQDALDDVLPEAFAAVREASKRTIGLRHYDVQLIGGIALHHGQIAEMRTGEGKTLVATLPLYLNALTGRGVHLVTVNDYLARRDARWMAPIYNALGMSVGVLQMAARTENGRKAFIVDLTKESPHEDQNQMVLVPRRDAYKCDMIYGTNSEFGFDYLRDNMTMSLEERVQRGHYYAIVDEVDNVLIDEARTPLIISGPATDDTEWYVRMAQVVRRLNPEDYEISERDRTITLSEAGEAHVEELLEMPLRDPNRPEDVTPEQARLMGYLEQALRAQFLFRRNKDYLVQAGKVIIVDEFTGRLMPGRRWSDGLHQAVEAKEGVKVEAENVTYATITIQNYFRMYQKLAGMTGTAVTEAEEFDKIYKLEVLAIPTNLEYQASHNDELMELEDRDEQGYKYQFYAHQDDSSHRPVYWRRKDYPDVIYRTEEAKFRAICSEILSNHANGRPVLVGTTSVELSERLSNRLRAEPLRRLAQVTILRDAYMKKNKREEDGRQISELMPLYEPLEQLSVPEMRKLATSLGVTLNPEDPANVERLAGLLNVESDPGSKERLVNDLKAGIPHEVLNARKHTEESQIIAGAGAFGAVTIATNMAGRGVDIKLGGELAEEISSAVNRVLRKAGYSDPYDMTLEERRQAILKLDPADYGIYDAEIHFFLEQMDNMERVKRLGGLHVLGSERHEARRIDNQLRGRAARQGDPGSSRFYLSLRDELMVRFGGQQADDLMGRLKVDDALPIEVGIVGRLVEQSQTRVEGANFDVRKHLLEYDDVLNSQRSKIYEQRDRIFVKDDLSEDVTDMLRVEVRRRVPLALKDEEGPWKLLAWLDSIQPPIPVNSHAFPTYTQRLLVDHLLSTLKEGQAKESYLNPLLKIAEESIRAEEEHVTKAVLTLIDQTEEHFDAQLREKNESLDTYLEGLSLEEGEEGEEGELAPKTARETADELAAMLRIPRMSNEQVRLLKEDPDEIADDLRIQLAASVASQHTARLLRGVERFLGVPVEISQSQLKSLEWEELADTVLKAVEAFLNKRREWLVGPEGQVTKDLEANIARLSEPVDRQALLNLLGAMPVGVQTSYDKKTHQRKFEQTLRFSYVYYAAHLFTHQDADYITEDVLEHLEEAQEAIRHLWGIAEWNRISNIPLNELEPRIQNGLRSMGEARFNELQNQPLSVLTGDEAARVKDELGRQVLTEIYRQLLLSVITELWVDYLTQMEALRVAIGLEAYAQRDPLVQYKSKASELFQELFNNMRLGVISRMFLTRPRTTVIQQTVNVRRPKEDELQPGDGAEAQALPEGEASEAALEGGEGPETEQETENEPSQVAAGSQPKQSKSQKRRRGRR